MAQEKIDTLLKETRSFPPPKEFAKKANVDQAKYQALCKQAKADPEGFWAELAESLHWDKKWDRVLEWKPPFAKWFLGGKLNASYNCLDRHLEKHGDKTALIYESEDGQVYKHTYRELHAYVCRLANVLEKDLGLKAGDTAAIYLPLIPEAVAAMLACARIGVTHSVIFAGFSQHAIRDRVNDAECKVIFTADIAMRKGTTLDLKKTVDAAVRETPSVKKVLVLRRLGDKTKLGKKDVDWAKAVEKQKPEHTAKPMDSEHPLFLLYTSGTTGKPKGIMHSTGGYLLGVSTTAKWIFDLKENDIYWCTADIGWVTGHSYLVYGILANAATAVLYEGVLTHPDFGRIWKTIDRHKVTILYTAPTAIRSFMREGDEHVDRAKLTSLRLLGSVGEPINPGAWIWYYEKVGRENCPIVDTWWQTETGSILISALPGVTTLRPGSATQALPGIEADIVDEDGKSVGPDEGGLLVIKKPWPSMLRGIYKDKERYQETYWSKFKDVYFAGDGAHKDKDGAFWIKGRVDDVLNVSGHRLGTMEIESALVSHPSVAEAAVVGRPDELKGQAIVAFVTPKDAAVKKGIQELSNILKKHVADEIGAIARPEEIKFTKTLPKTRSGKIMRRLLKDLAAGKEATGDTTTLENPGLVEFIE